MLLQSHISTMHVKARAEHLLLRLDFACDMDGMAMAEVVVVADIACNAYSDATAMKQQQCNMHFVSERLALVP